MNQFESVEQIQNNIDLQGEYFNAFVCEQLESYFEQRGCKLPIEFVKSVNEKTYINQNGAKRYSLLPLQEHTQTYDVLSVGVDSNLTPTIVIKKNGKQECFRLPNDLNEWACICNSGCLQRSYLFFCNSSVFISYWCWNTGGVPFDGNGPECLPV